MNNRLSIHETKQCYIKARNKLSKDESEQISAHMDSLQDNVKAGRYHPTSDYMKLEILAKLGIWINKELADAN